MSGWTIGRKITAAVLLILVQALGVAAYGFWTANRTGAQMKLLSSMHLPEKEMAARIETELLNARIHFIYYVTIQKEGSLDKGWGRFQNAQHELPKLRALIDRSQVFVDLRPDVQQLSEDFNSYVPALEHIIEIVRKGQNHGPEFDATIREWAQLGGAMVDSAGRLSHHGSRATDDLIGSASAQLRVAAIALGISCLTSLLLGIAISSILTRNISKGLRKVIGKLGETSRQVAHAASQISGSAKSVAEGASQQAASLEETSASSEEISSMANSNQENAVQAAANMTEVSGSIQAANRNLKVLEVSMSEINASSDKISKIIKVIDEIAFQTNILALNAAVEAARAGEAGMGFAVVADEVRNLAQRCAEAARDTSGLIEESITRSRDGKHKLDQMSLAIHSITDSAGKVKKLFDQVRQGSQEQSRGIEQVVRSITQIENVTQTAAASAQENAAASEELKAQSEMLRGVIDQLDVMVGGAETASAV